MKIQTARPFDDDYSSLPENVKNKADKQLAILIDNPQHPSLHIKKIKGHPNIWEGGITIKYRFTFQIFGETYLLRRIGKHDVIKTP
jgi:mRNA-degrading endonuclease RelE of RelBE toxin-antitoxin system